MQQKLIELKAEIDTSTITDDDFNTPLSAINRTTREKNQQEYKRTQQHHQIIESY